MHQTGEGYVAEVTPLIYEASQRTQGERKEVNLDDANSQAQLLEDSQAFCCTSCLFLRPQVIQEQDSELFERNHFREIWSTLASRPDSLEGRIRHSLNLLFALSMQVQKYYSTSMSTKHQPVSVTVSKHQLLSQAFSDCAFQKYRSQSNTTDPINPTPKPSIRGFQIVRTRGISRQSEFIPPKSAKKVFHQHHHSQPNIQIRNREEIMRQVHEKIQDGNELHDKLISIFEIDKAMKRNLELNHLIIQDKRPESQKKDIRDDIYILLLNSIEKIGQFINQNYNENSHLRKAHKRVAVGIQQHFQELVNTLLTAFVSVDQDMAILIENLWKLLAVSFELLSQNFQSENEYIQHEVLKELQDELQAQKKENAELYNRYLSLQTEMKEQQRIQKQEINSVQFQLNVVKAEYNDFKALQEQLATFDNANGCLKDVDKSLKDTQKLLNKIEEGLISRDTQIFHSMKSVIGQYRIEREGELTKTQRITKDYRLRCFSPKQLAILQEYFCHPFVPYINVKTFMSDIEMDERILQQHLVDWFHSCLVPIHFGPQPSQTRLEQLQQLERKSCCDSFAEFLWKQNKLDQLQLVVKMISKQTENMQELSMLPKVEKFNKQICHFFSILFCMDPVIEVSQAGFSKIVHFYNSLKIAAPEDQTPRSDQPTNKFNWYNFVIQNLQEVGGQCFGDYLEKMLQGQQTLIQVLLTIIVGENDKRKLRVKKLLEDYRITEKESEQEAQLEKLNAFALALAEYFSPILETQCLQMNPQDWIFRYCHALYERCIRLNSNKMKKVSRRVPQNMGLEYNDWNQLVLEAYTLINDVLALKPQLHQQIIISSDLQLINAGIEHLAKMAHLERRESSIKKK